MSNSCRWHYEDGMRFLVPGCWNRVVHGDDAECHCVESEADELRRKVGQLEAKIYLLQVQIKELNKEK